MRLAEFPAFAPNAAFREAVRDTALPMQGSGGFAGLYQQVAGEVADFIANGSSESSSAGAALSAEGRAWQARLAAPVDVSTATSGEDGVTTDAQRQFLSRIAPWAKDAGRALGVSPDVLSAQAALESGWGQRPLHAADGSDSHNLFGVKATGAWQGDVVSAVTTEVEGDGAVKKTEAFRRYNDEGASFRDLVQLLQGAPRYHAALNTGSDARAYGLALMRGGYATDPAYADKLVRIATRIRAED